ncbi:MAG: hypothetical protein GY942_04570, partial [Aestuariibacter sp.]|nr:hypothetical protein [Aestuariibacter sp.]
GGTAANIGAVRTITGFTPASDLITFSPALVATVAAADTFEILAGNFGVIDTGNDDGVILSASQSNAVAFAENVSMAKGLTITNSVTNGHGISATGDGTGEGISCTGGSAGHGFRAAGTGVGNGIVGVGGATDGAGLVAAGLAAGAGVSIAGGVTGNGVTVSGGATSGDGINVSVTSGQGLDVDGVDMSTDLTAIKTKTDSLTFTVAGDVDANIQSIVDAGISEGGSDPGSPIGET